jgi:hypothetical protein
MFPIPQRVKGSVIGPNENVLSAEIYGTETPPAGNAKLGETMNPPSILPKKEEGPLFPGRLPFPFFVLGDHTESGP